MGHNTTYKNAGFTLIELMAVLALLAVIALIAVPAIGGIINSAQSQANENTASMVEKSAGLAEAAGVQHDVVDGYRVSTLIDSGHLDWEMDDARVKDLGQAIQSESGYTYRGGVNYFSPTDVRNLALSGTATSGSITASGGYRGWYMPVEAGEVFTIERDAMTNNRFDYLFTETEPKSGTKVFGGNSSHRNDLKIENVRVPNNAKYIFVYLSNASDPIPNITVTKQ